VARGTPLSRANKNPHWWPDNSPQPVVSWIGGFHRGWGSVVVGVDVLVSEHVLGPRVGEATAGCWALACCWRGLSESAWAARAFTDRSNGWAAKSTLAGEMRGSVSPSGVLAGTAATDPSVDFAVIMRV
jgi:hypothetical protein